jgi:SNF2 family DNA or RNA helicase
MLFHPSLKKTETNCGEIRTVLLVVPVNTLANWENEVETWTGQIHSSIPVHNMSDGSNRRYRDSILQRWIRKGGILLISEQTFQRATMNGEHAKFLQDPGPDTIILDEAHTMLKNTSNKVFKALMQVKTCRRICLSGSPFQNNLFEYFRMVSYVRPGLLGKSEGKFEKEYVNPINQGTAADASEDEKQVADKKLAELQEKTQPYVHRKDAAVLLQDLPPMQQVVLTIRQTKLQSKLYGAHKRRMAAGNEANNFFKQFHTLRPIHNHPGCLLNSKLDASAAKPSISHPIESTVPFKVKKEVDSSSEKMKISKGGCEMNHTSDIIDLIDSDSDSETFVDNNNDNNQWWMKVAQKEGLEEVSNVTNGNKVVLLLHILSHASMLNEKVVVFSQCLKVSHKFRDMCSLILYAWHDG